jgi:hypothetical protein
MKTIKALRTVSALAGMTLCAAALSAHRIGAGAGGRAREPRRPRRNFPGPAAAVVGQRVRAADALRGGHNYGD